MTVYELDRVQVANGRRSAVRNAGRARSQDFAQRIRRSRIAHRVLGVVLAALAATAVVMAVVATAAPH